MLPLLVTEPEFSRLGETVGGCRQSDSGKRLWQQLWAGEDSPYLLEQVGFSAKGQACQHPIALPGPGRDFVHGHFFIFICQFYRQLSTLTKDKSGYFSSWTKWGIKFCMECKDCMLIQSDVLWRSCTICNDGDRTILDYKLSEWKQDLDWLIDLTHALTCKRVHPLSPSLRPFSEVWRGAIELAPPSLAHSEWYGTVFHYTNSI